MLEPICCPHETGRSFNTRIKEHKACQRLGDGDKSATIKHAQQQQHKINWEDGSLITSIPHWHTRWVREAIEILQRNTVHKIAGYTSMTSGTLSCRKHIIKHCFTKVRNQLNIKFTSLTSATNTQVIHTPVILLRTVSSEWPKIFTFSTSRHLLRTTTWCYRKLHLIIWRHQNYRNIKVLQCCSRKFPRPHTYAQVSNSIIYILDFELIWGCFKVQVGWKNALGLENRKGLGETPDH